MTMIRRCMLPMAAILAVLTLAAGTARADQVRIATEGTYQALQLFDTPAAN